MSCLKKCEVSIRFSFFHRCFDLLMWLLRHGPPHKFAFMPFSHGPRACIGREFTLLEQKITLASLTKLNQHWFVKVSETLKQIGLKVKKHEICLNVFSGWCQVKLFQNFDIEQVPCKEAGFGRIWSMLPQVCTKKISKIHFMPACFWLRRCLAIHQWKQMVSIHLS